MLDMQTIGYLNYMQEEENKRKEKQQQKEVNAEKNNKMERETATTDRK